MPVNVALLRGINVSGRNKIAMAELRALAGDLGWQRPESYIQSGNMVFDAEGDLPELEAALEEGIRKRFSLDIPVVVRTGSKWPDYIGANPFPKAAEKEPNRLMLLLSKRSPQADAAGAIQERAKNGEQVKAAGGALWIHFPEGAGTSKLTPVLIDRLAGSPSTARNWNTVLKLGEMLAR